MRACSALRRVGRVDRAAALNSNMKSCGPAGPLPCCLHLSQRSSFSFLASSQLPVSCNLSLFRLQCLHQAAVRLHQRVKVTTVLCFWPPAASRSKPQPPPVSAGFRSSGAARSTSVSAAIIGMLKNLYCGIDPR